MDIYIYYRRGATFRDNKENDLSGKEYKAYDTVQKEWRHMNFFQHECYPHARCQESNGTIRKVRLIPLPWSGKLNGFTLLFEAFVIQMCRSMPVHHVSKLTSVSDHRLWTLQELDVNAARFIVDPANQRDLPAAVHCTQQRRIKNLSPD